MTRYGNVTNQPRPEALWTLLAGFLVLLGLASPRFCQAQVYPALTPGYVIVSRTDSRLDVIRKAASVVPAPRQLRWESRELSAFVHFGMNTFADQEWGSGKEDPALFNPTAFDARQWVRVLKDAGMKELILTAKHHDGFCLWPSKYTTHSVRSSPWRNGRGDVVAEVASACRSAGMAFGIYLSPWDRHDSAYGDSPRYNKYFQNQLRELLTGYGDIAEVWFDGACGEGPNGKRQEYDWQSYYALVRELQPDAVIAVMGPDVRWVGTETGEGRLTEWSVIPETAGGLDSVAAHSQMTVRDDAFTPGDLTGEDLGSRSKLYGAHALRWYPSEADVSIRPGWFYHADQNLRVKTPPRLVELYFSSVGRNSALLLNVPADKRGRIADCDAKSLRGMKALLDRTFQSNLLRGADVLESNPSIEHPARIALDVKGESYWGPVSGGDSGSVVFSWARPCAFDCAMLQEEIRLGQHVERFRIEQWKGGAWSEIAGGTTIGEKRLLRFPLVSTQKVRFVIEQSRGPFMISALGLFRTPGKVTIVPAGGAFEDSVFVRLSYPRDNVTIRYTVDGLEPGRHSLRYTSPFVLRGTAAVRARAFPDNIPGVELSSADFIKSRRMGRVNFQNPPSPKYSGGADSVIIDGRHGDPEQLEGGWLGFEGDDCVATVTLDAECPIRAVHARFLQRQESYVFLPESVSAETSVDGVAWKMLGRIDSPNRQSPGVLTRDYVVSGPSALARYIRFTARNLRNCPPWHRGAGEKAWIFIDEIAVE